MGPGEARARVGFGGATDFASRRIIGKYAVVQS